MDYHRLCSITEHATLWMHGLHESAAGTAMAQMYLFLEHKNSEPRYRYIAGVRPVS